MSPVVSLPMLVALSLVALSTSAQVTPAGVVDQLESTFGKFEGFRRSGARGVCATGEFVGSAEGRALSRSSAFSGRAVPVVLRFSVGGADPNAPDNTRAQRNLALQLNLPEGEVWQISNISAPVFRASSLQQFLGLLRSLEPDPVTQLPDPARVKAFAEANPEVLTQGRHFAGQPVPASFASVEYWGVHTFGFVNDHGERQWGKWVFEPVGGTSGLSDDEARAKGPEFLIDELRQRVTSGHVAFEFRLQLAQPGDRLDSATTPLPDDRRVVTLGRLTVKQVGADRGGECLRMAFNPLRLPQGVEPSADPLLPARAAAYPAGLARRLVEGAKQ